MRTRFKLNGGGVLGCKGRMLHLLTNTRDCAKRDYPLFIVVVFSEEQLRVADFTYPYCADVIEERTTCTGP